MAHDAFYKLFLHELSGLYSIEHQILEALPDMIQSSTTPELKDALEHHLKETKNQVKRLDQVFSELGEEYSGEKSEGISGILEEGQEIIKFSDYPDRVKDAAIIAAAQRIEHYEIASYGTARTFAEHLNLEEIVELLQKTLDEEAEADKKLTEIARGGFFTSGVIKKAMEE